jgi:cytochrome b subunit of formate dehydrogenase
VASYGVLFKKWRPSILISKKDFTDAVDNLKYYFGLTNHPARCDRYDYKQKFEYWGILAGGLIMIGTGLTLWFPIVVARFLPGSIIPAAKALHTNVAMMIFLIISLWHIYNSIFSPEVFPLDTAIFTGRISLDRVMREHPIEFERLFGVSLEETRHGIVSHKELRQERQQESS